MTILLNWVEVGADLEQAAPLTNNIGNAPIIYRVWERKPDSFVGTAAEGSQSFMTAFSTKADAKRWAEERWSNFTFRLHE